MLSIKNDVRCPMCLEIITKYEVCNRIALSSHTLEGCRNIKDFAFTPSFIKDSCYYVLYKKHGLLEVYRINRKGEYCLDV